MTKTRLDIHEKMLLALLKASLNVHIPDLVWFEAAKPEDWKECAQLAKRQGVLALAWDGVCRLPENLQPYTDLKISWALAVEKYEKKYAHYCETVNELSTFYREHGISMVQLKGVGLSTYYPVPSHREGGDIDIYTYSSDTDILSHEEANRLADCLMLENDIDVERDRPKHTHFRFHDITIENHTTFLDIERSPVSAKVEVLLSKILSPRQVELIGGHNIMIPSDDFNVLFVAFHAIQHYGCGLSLHHLCDWACLIKRFGLTLQNVIDDSHLMKGIVTMTSLCNEYLGTDVKVDADHRLMNEMLYEIFNPFDESAMPETGALDRLVFKCKRFEHKVRTRNRFIYTPLWRNKEFWEKVKKSIKWHFNKILDLI